MSRRLIWDTFTRSLWVRAVALALVTALVVVQCGREGGTARSLSNLNYDSLPAKAPRPTKPAERLHADVTELKDLLAIQSKRDLSGDQADKARSARRRIATELGAIHRQFADDRAKLQKLDAKAALKRLDNIESRTTKLALTLNTALARIPDDGPRATVPAGDAVDALTALSPDKPEQPLSSASDFGFGLDKAKPRSPELSAGITPAYGSPTPTDVASELPRTPEQEDLAATPETKATPAIQDLAGRLDHDPVKIYEYVRNEIRYETYYGLRKGADQTLAEKSGSDADQAALLIALLRESGVHARFVQGVTQLPIDTAANWLGVDVQSGERIESVPQILTSSGIPTTQIRANGQLTKIRFDHFWVEAYVSTQTYRGIDEQIGKKQWLPLDASIKPTVIKRPTADFRALMEPIAKGLAQDLVAATHAQGDAIVQPDRNALDAIRQKSTDRLQSLMRDEGVTSRQPGSDILGGTEIRRTSASYLPASLPAQVLAVSAEARAVPASLQSRVTFSVSGSDPLSLPEPDTDPGAGGLTFTAPTSELANKRITLAYVPAGAQDAEIIDAYHGLLNAPSYAASLIPVLRVGGRVVARGRTAVSTGYTQTFEITYRSPNFAADTVTNPVYVGSLSAIGLDVGTASSAQLAARADALRQLASTTTAENILTDGRGGEMLSQLAGLYFYRNDAFNAPMSRAMGVHQTRAVSGAITATNITPTYIASFPVSTKFDGLTIDVDQDAQVAVDKTDAEPSVNQYMGAAGTYASASEAAIFEYALGWDAASTTQVLQAAAEQGVPVHQVTAQNVGAEVERLQLPAAVEQRITTAVATPGVEVLVPEREITIGGWSGVGYVVSSASSFDSRISGGFSGGAAKKRDSQNVQADMAAGVKRHSERVKEGYDCDLVNLGIMYMMLLLLALLLIFLIAYMPASLPIVAVETVEFLPLGAMIHFPAAAVLAIPVSSMFVLGALAVAETKDCLEQKYPDP